MRHRSVGVCKKKFQQQLNWEDEKSFFPYMWHKTGKHMSNPKCTPISNWPFLHLYSLNSLGFSAHGGLVRDGEETVFLSYISDIN